jgi:transposase
MAHFDPTNRRFVGRGGALAVRGDDEVSFKLAMLIEGECGGQSRRQVAEKYGYSRQRYFELRAAFRQKGAQALVSHKRGPKTRYRQSVEVVSQAIRHRLLDPDASTDAIAQKLRQGGFAISKRTVDRIFARYGLQKKGSSHLRVLPAEPPWGTRPPDPLGFIALGATAA